MGLATPSNSLSGSLLAASSPAVSREIGDYFKTVDPQTGKDKQGTAAHVMAHMVWNAATAYAAGNNAGSAALSAGASEVAAPVISNWLFDEKDPSKLPTEQKETLANITRLLGTGIGASTGNAQDAASDSLISSNVTEHNSSAQAGRALAVPLFGALYCALDKTCESVTETFIGMLAEQHREAEKEREAIFAAMSGKDGGKKAQTNRPAVGKSGRYRLAYAAG